MKLKIVGNRLFSTQIEKHRKVPRDTPNIYQQSVLGLRGKVLVVGGATGVASVRSCWKLPLCLIEPMPAGSKTDPLLAKAEPINDSGSASVITYLRKGKSYCAAAIAARRQD